MSLRMNYVPTIVPVKRAEYSCFVEVWNLNSNQIILECAVPQNNTPKSVTGDSWNDSSLRDAHDGPSIP